MVACLSMTWLLSLLCLIVNLQSVTGSQIVFSSSPRSIQPSLTKSLQLNCSLEDTATSPVGGVVGRSVTNTSTNMAHVTSILVMRDGLDVASITTFTSAKPMSDLGNLKVTGDVSGATQGFLHLIWTYPTDQEIGEFTCTVNAVSDTGHITVFSKTLEVVAMDTTVSDLIKELRDVKIVLQNQSKRIHDLEMATENIDPRHIENGTIICDNGKKWPVVSLYNTKSVSQQFTSSYVKSPVVHLSLTRIQENHVTDILQTYLWTELTDVDERGFTVTCNVLNHTHFNDVSIVVSWISIGV